MLHFHTVLLDLHSSYIQLLSSLVEISCHTATHHTHLVLAVTGTMLHFHTVLLDLHSSYIQLLSSLEEISCHTATHHTHLVLAVTGTMLHFHTVLLDLHSSYIQLLSSSEEISCHTATHHTHLVLAVTAASHPPPALTLSPRYVNSLTVYTSSHIFSSCSTASHFLHVRFLDIFGVTLFS